MVDSTRLDPRLLNEGETPIFDMLSGRGRLNSPVEWLSRCIDRRKANDDGWLIQSSLLSEGRLPLEAIVEGPFMGSFGSAEGQRVARDVSCPRLDELLDVILGAPNTRLVPLSVRVSSELVFLFSSIPPPPAIMTGLMRSRRNGS
jgi:hypothetical protein